MANGINNNKGYQFNSNINNYTYMYYSNSAAKITLESWYKTNLSNYLSYISSGNYFCEQAKVKYSSNWTSGSASMTIYTSYTPNFKCSTDGNGKGIINLSIGLITYDEVVFAGGYLGKENNSYYLYNGVSYWTMSPAGYSSGYARIWFNSSGLYDYLYGSNTLPLYPVVNLKADTLTTGTGTSSDPYVIK